MSLPERFGRYEVVEILGQGAMGIVYKARDPVIERQVAVKVVQANPGLGHDDLEKLQARFEREFRSAGALSHPNIVTVFDVGKEDDLYYVAMEYVVGQTLDAVLGARRVLPPGEVADLADQLASALDYAHDRGVIHRDVKPANVLVTDAGEARITDFGLAKIPAGSLTRTGALIGTPAYMSPEQVNDAEVSGASDQFSLATMLYRMLTGERPFIGDTPSTILYKIVHEDPVAPQRLNRTLPDAAGEVLLRALDKDPERRFPTCTDLAGALRTALGLDPAETVVTGAMERAGAGPRPAAATSHGPASPGSSSASGPAPGTVAGPESAGGSGSPGDAGPATGAPAGAGDAGAPATAASGQQGEGASASGPQSRGTDPDASHGVGVSGTAQTPVLTASPAGLAFVVALVGLPTLALLVTLWFLLGDRSDPGTAGAAGSPGTPDPAVTGEPDGGSGPTDDGPAQPAKQAGGADDPASEPPVLDSPEPVARTDPGGPADPPATTPGGDLPGDRLAGRNEFSLLERLGLSERARAVIGEGTVTLEGGVPVTVQINRASPTFEGEIPDDMRSRLQQLASRIRESLGELRGRRDRPGRLPPAPVHVLELPTGSYTLQVLQPRLYLRQQHEVDLRRGDEVHIALPARAVRVTLDSGRAGGRVSMINGIAQDAGGRRPTLSLPADVTLALGTNLVEVEWPGAGTNRVQIEVERQGQRFLLTPAR